MQYLFIHIMNEISLILITLLVLGTTHYLCYYFGQHYGNSINRFFRYYMLKVKRFRQGRHKPDKSGMKLNT